MPIEKLLSTINPSTNTAVTVGVFDGVHIGHQSLLAFLNRKARHNGWLSTAITFETHPETIVFPGKQHAWRTDLPTRLRLIKQTGVDFVIALPFDKIVQNISVGQFTGLLKKYLKMSGLVIGPDFAMGCDRAGTPDKLRQMGLKRGFSVDVVNPFFYNGEIISSTAIRNLLAEGNVKKAGRFLGRPFSYTGLVIEGDQRGRKLGFPTANLEPLPELAIPGDGIYMTTADNSKIMPAVTNIGIRPTFKNGQKRLIETNILDYSGDLYHKKISIDFIARIRDEKKFDTVDDLTKQMARDVATVRSQLSAKLSHEETVEWRN
jgi:riboflavin kinase/FMN adenylyltransferase